MHGGSRFQTAGSVGSVIQILWKSSLPERRVRNPRPPSAQADQPTSSADHRGSRSTTDCRSIAIRAQEEPRLGPCHTVVDARRQQKMKMRLRLPARKRIVTPNAIINSVHARDGVPAA